MSRARPRARRGPWPGVIVLLVVLMLLGAGLYFVDGYAEREVERMSMSDLQNQLATPEPPTVDIEGSAFLPQVAARSFKSIRVTANQVGASSDQTLIIAQVDLRLSDVSTLDWFDTMTVSHAEGTARIDYSVLQALAGIPLTYVGDGRVEITTTTTVLGQDVNARITGKPRLNVGDQTVTLADPQITVAGVNLPEFTAQALLRAVLKPIPIGDLPIGLTVIAIDPRDDGIHAELVGDNLLIDRAG
ncbi:MAG TPA: DUF2993 domain-containing protein [Propionibacteriaceae bacterium]|nr:DUF2993 domain-containing protein [Propionibacteriaceae bacterium]